ncbi:hypothetical protein TWF694_002910 [Orbilia ellipsospora]|uniref:Apple domain-containing protein n=1 Tax=Orbilia ellipsospora TaxID=2528407 RepID=A0AAV9X001_9PEZI
MRFQSAFSFASLSAVLFCETVIAVPAPIPAPAAAKNVKITYTTIPVTSVYVSQVTTTVPVTINTSIKTKGKYTFPPDVVITVKSAPTKLKTTTYGTTIYPTTITSIYYTKIPVTPAPAPTTSAKGAAKTTSTTAAVAASCTGVQGSASEAYFNVQIGDYYANIPDAASCSQKCALFDDCYAFEFLPLANVDPNYPQNCWLYIKPFEGYVTEGTTGFFFYDQSCFAPVKGVTQHTYPSTNVCGNLWGVSTQYGRTGVGASFAGSIDQCAQYCLSQSNCAVYMYSEIEFQDGNNCHTYSGALGDVSAVAGQPVATVEDMRSHNVYRIAFERACALAA